MPNIYIFPETVCRCRIVSWLRGKICSFSKRKKHRPFPFRAVRARASDLPGFFLVLSAACACRLLSVEQSKALVQDFLCHFEVSHILFGRHKKFAGGFKQSYSTFSSFLLYLHLLYVKKRRLSSRKSAFLKQFCFTAAVFCVMMLQKNSLAAGGFSGRRGKTVRIRCCILNCKRRQRGQMSHCFRKRKWEGARRG